jgi:hypothetical protein
MSGNPLPPTSPLAVFPSPFAEDTRALLADLSTRTFSRFGDDQYAAPSDRIARNYTPTAAALTATALAKRLASGAVSAGPESAARGAGARPAAAGAAGAASGSPGKGRGPALVTSAEDAAPRLSLARAVAGGGARGGGGGGDPQPLPTLTIPRRGARPASYYTTVVPDLKAEGSWNPPTQEQSEGAALEAAIQSRHAQPSAAAGAAALERAVGAYWRAVNNGARDYDGAQHRLDWEDGILAR